VPVLVLVLVLDQLETDPSPYSTPPAFGLRSVGVPWPALPADVPFAYPLKDLLSTTELFLGLLPAQQ